MLIYTEKGKRRQFINFAGLLCSNLVGTLRGKVDCKKAGCGRNYERMNEWMDGLTGKWTDGWMDR